MGYIQWGRKRAEYDWATEHALLLLRLHLLLPGTNEIFLKLLEWFLKCSLLHSSPLSVRLSVTTRTFFLKHGFACDTLLLKIKAYPFSRALRSLCLFNLVSHHFLFIQPAVPTGLLFPEDNLHHSASTPSLWPWLSSLPSHTFCTPGCCCLWHYGC